MKLSFRLKDIRPCKWQLHEVDTVKQQLVAEHVHESERAVEASKQARRRLATVRIIIETADNAGRFFGRRSEPS